MITNLQFELGSCETSSSAFCEAANSMAKSLMKTWRWRSLPAANLPTLLELCLSPPFRSSSFCLLSQWLNLSSNNWVLYSNKAMVNSPQSPSLSAPKLRKQRSLPRPPLNNWHQMASSINNNLELSLQAQMGVCLILRNKWFLRAIMLLWSLLLQLLLRMELFRELLKVATIWWVARTTIQSQSCRRHSSQVLLLSSRTIRQQEAYPLDSIKFKLKALWQSLVKKVKFQ